MEYHYQSPWFVEPLQKEDNLEINQLDLNIDSLIEFCYEMKRKDEKGSKISNIGGWQSKNVVNEVHEEFTKLKIEVEKFANEYHRELEFKETLQQKIGIDKVFYNILLFSTDTG